jgi:hypothetical protein
LANEIPNAHEYSGLSRKVLQYSDAFSQLLDRTKSGPLSDADWAPLEALIDTEIFERVGVFSTARAEVIGWPQYKSYLSQFAGGYRWEGTLRHITESPGRVILELEERSTIAGTTHVANTVTIYQFTDAGKLHHLDVYVMPLGER